MAMFIFLRRRGDKDDPKTWRPKSVPPLKKR